MPFFRLKSRRPTAHKISQLSWQGHDVQVTRKTMKSIRLRVSQDNQLRLSCPFQINDDALLAFLTSRKPWIQQQLQQTQSIAQRQAETNNQHQMSLWGKSMAINCNPDLRAAFKFSENAHHIEIPTVPSGTEDVTQLHQTIWRAELKTFIQEVLPHWQDRMGVNATFWNVRNMKTKWGSCNVNRRRIWLNIHLAQYPKACAEMVLVHELVHLLEASHNKRFYQLMDHFLPDWRHADALLKNPDFAY